MPEHDATLTLSADGAEPTRASSTVSLFNPAQRARRAIVALLIGAAVAAALIPIPIVHLLGIPLALIAAIVVAMKQLRVAARIDRVALACPKCAVPQAIGGGFGFSTIDGPIAITCDSCRRIMTLTIDLGGAPARPVMIELLRDPQQLHSGAPWWLVRNGLAEQPEVRRDECDVAVIGAGITGVMVADRLAEAGLAVTLVDRRAPGYGSTAVSTALVQYELDTQLFQLAAKIGTADARRAYALSYAAVHELRDLVRSLGADCGYAARSSLYLATSKAGAVEVGKEVAARTEAGFDVEAWSAAEVKRRYGLPSRGALRNEHAAVVDPVRLCRALLDRTLARGAGIMPRTTATRVVRDERGFVVETDRGELRARQVVLALGYEVPESLIGDQVTRHSTYAMVTEPVDHLGPLEDGCLIWETRRPYTYLRTTDERRILVGGGDVDFTSPSDRDKLLPARSRMLQRKLDRMLPALEARLEFSWAGTFVATDDGLPIIGPVDGMPGVWSALGYGGNGITFAVIAARLLASACLGQPSDDLRLFRPDR